MPDHAPAPRPFRQVDVFSAEPYRGNPVAVVHDADGLDDATMAGFARWTNLSETTFVLRPTTPGADYRVRIFTPDGELPFAGHPTLGTCHAWLEAGGVPADPADPDDPDVPVVVVQECAAGLVRVRRDGAALAFAAPPLVRSGPVDAETLDRVVAGLRIERSAVLDAQWVDNGPGWLAVRLVDAAAVAAVRPGPLDRLCVGVVGPHPPGGPADVEVRAFFPGGAGSATVEDPVTGSLNASLAPWLVRTGHVTLPYTAAQGAALERAGRVRLSGDVDGDLWVGGDCTTCITGTVTL